MARDRGGHGHAFALGTSGNADAMGRLMRRTAGRLRIDLAQEHVAIVDGAKWIRQQLITRLPMVETRISEPNAQGLLALAALKHSRLKVVGLRGIVPESAGTPNLELETFLD
jgi:hypothetical protein